MSALTWTRLSPGHYESSAGHWIDRIGRQWFITYPGERAPDVTRDTLAEARAYVEQFAESERAA